MIKIAVVTSSRADYGLLKPILIRLKNDTYFDLKLIVTGSHLSESHGNTITNIRDDKFEIHHHIAINSEESEDFGAGQVVSAVSRCLKQLKPDCLMILGDRYEILAVALAATLHNVPIIHLCGGDISAGAFDDSIRHAITKLSHLHFPSNHEAAKRLQQMGEPYETIFQHGSPGLDLIKNIVPNKHTDILRKIGVGNITTPFYLATFHPVTLKEDKGLSELDNLLQALSKYNENHQFNIIFTGGNTDPGAELIKNKILSFCQQHKNCFYTKSFGSEKYISLMKNCQAVVGNSSSGFYEAPFLKKPTINIGSRQSGRLSCDSIFNATSTLEILYILDKISKSNFDHVSSPYGDGNTAEKIINSLKTISSFKSLLNKKFIDLS